MSQGERDEVATALGRHFADGRLTVEEYEERVGAALTARTGRDLEAPMADLPAEDPPVPPRRDDRRPSRADRNHPRTGRPVLPTARILAIAAVVILAVNVGLWALWLLWPAIALTGGCGFGGRHHASHRSFVETERTPVGTIHRM